MKRRFLAALLVVTLLVPVITACHDSSTQTATKDVKATGYDPKEACLLYTSPSPRDCS